MSAFLDALLGQAWSRPANTSRAIFSNTFSISSQSERSTRSYVA